jgi:hypothetical protein
MDPFEYYIDRYELLRWICRGMMRHPLWSKDITMDDLLDECLDKLPRILEKDDGQQSTTNTWVVKNLRGYLRNYMAARRLRESKYTTLSTGVVNTVLRDEVAELDSKILSRQCYEILRQNMSAYEVRLLVLHDAMELNFTDIAEQVSNSDVCEGTKSRATVQRDYLSAMWKARRIMKGVWT